MNYEHKKIFTDRIGYCKHQFRDHGAGRHDEHFVKEVPKGGKEVVYKDVHYHYSEGRFYRPQNEGFEMVEPPVGCEVYELPKGYAVKKHKGVTYYYKDNVCFKRGAKKGSYVVVKRPW